MKTLQIVLLIAALAITGVLAVARQAPSRDQRLVASLNLTADQKGKVDPVLEDAAQKLRAIRTDTALSDDDKKTRSAAVSKETDEKLKAILTDDQWKKLQQLRGEGKKK